MDPEYLNVCIQHGWMTHISNGVLSYQSVVTAPDRLVAHLQQVLLSSDRVQVDIHQSDPRHPRVHTVVVLVGGARQQALQPLQQVLPP